MTTLKKKTTKKKRIKNSLTSCKDAYQYLQKVLKKKILVSKKLYKQCQIIDKEFKSGNIEVNLEMYNKYLKIGFLFFIEIFDWQKFALCVCLCTFYKGTTRARWNKVLIVVGRGNGKDGIIAWWSCCLTSTYHHIKHYDVDIIANNMSQALRPIQDIKYMASEKDKESFYEKIGDSIVSYATDSFINARSSDAKMQDGLRSGAVVFNEVHGYENYSKLNVMITGLGKIEDPRQMYFTTNGEVRGGVLDDMLDTASDVLDGIVDDKRFLYLIYELDNKQEAMKEKNWVKANPSLPYRENLLSQITDEYDLWRKNPDNMPAFLQKRMNLPEMPTDQEVVPWELILKTNQDYDYRKLDGKSCVLGIDLSKTTDWTAINLLFYDEDLDKFVSINHAFICGNNRDLAGIKAPYKDWCQKGFGTIVDCKDLDPRIPISYAFNLAEEHDYNIEHVVIDDFKKIVLAGVLEEYGYTKEGGNLTLARPLVIAPIVPVIERMFINERLIWGDNPMLRWATNNTKLVPWKPNSTGNADMGNQLYGKINRRFRKTDPFMAFVHSMIKFDLLEEQSYSYDDVYRGF